MLVVSMKPQEFVYVGFEGIVMESPVVVSLVKMQLHQVRIGFQGPATVPIDRQAVRQSKIGDGFYDDIAPVHIGEMHQHERESYKREIESLKTEVRGLRHLLESK